MDCSNNISPGKLFVYCYLLFSVYVAYAAEHWWNFDEATSLYNIVDKISKTKASIRDGGAKLTRHEFSTNNYLTLEGRSSSLELGRFSTCIGDLTACSNGFSFSLWLRTRSTRGESQYILGNKDTGTSAQGFYLLRTEQDEMKFAIRDSNAKTHLTFKSSSGKWIHYMFTWNKRQVSLYVNGRKLLLDGRKEDAGYHSIEGRESSLRKKRTMNSGLFSLGRHGFKIDADYDDLMFWSHGLNKSKASAVYYRDLDIPVITGCSSTASSICVNWKPTSDAFGRIHSLSLAYHYLYQIDAPTHVSLNSTARHKCIGFLGSLTTYLFNIQVDIGKGIEPIKGQTVECRTTDGIPNAPNLSIGDKTATSLEVIWLTPSPANGAITAYAVTVKEFKTKAVKVDFEMNAHETLPGKIGTYRLNVTNLARGTEYEINVQALSELGRSVISTVQGMTEGNSASEESPNTVKISGDTMKIGWRSVEYAISYRVHVKPLNGNSTFFDVKKNSTELTSLKPSTYYVIDVQPIFSWGMGPRFVKNLKVKTPSQKVIPTGVRAFATRWDRVLVNWTRLPINDVKCIVFLKKDDGKEISRETKNNELTFDNVEPLTTYFVYIQTKFSWGTGPRTFANAFVTTEDMDECVQRGSSRCHRNADCFNIEGSYLCQCKKGYVGDGFNCRPMPKNAKRSEFCGESTFRDIKWPRMFHGGTAVRRCPKGTTGFASRKCVYDAPSQSSIYSLPNLSDCVSKGVLKFANMVENRTASAIEASEQLTRVAASMKLYGGDVRKTVVYYDKFIARKLNSGKLVQGLSQSLVDAIGNLLNNSVLPAWEDLPKNVRSDVATNLFNGLENLAQKLFVNLNNSTLTQIFSTANIDMKLQRVNGANEKLDYFEPRAPVGNERQSRISLPTNEIMAQKGRKTVEVVYFAYTNVNKILGIDKSQTTRSKHGSMDILNSKVVSAVVVGADKMVFETPVVLVLPHLKEAPVINTSCVFWNISRRPQSKWLDTGCYVNDTNVNETVCHCYHLTNFAVLMTVSTKPATSQKTGHQFALRIITIIGLTISIIAMSIAFFTFCSFRFLRGPRTTYHAQLVAALLLANLLFLVGIDKTSNKIACSLIAILLHYFFIVAFVWMAMEGILLYFMLKKIFSSRNFLKRKRCCIICWIIPALYVALLGVLKIEHYGNSSFCWISRKDGFIWSFVAPVSIALLVNFTVMGFALQVMLEKRSKGPDDGAISSVWYWLKGLLVLTCLLGVTWILGVFYVDSNTIAFAYVFTLLNALQGLFIFIFHCLIDARVRSEYVRLLKCQKRSVYNEKAGYSSSMKFRKLSGSVKSLGSLDRSLSRGSGKRNLSNSLDRSLSKQNDGSISEYGRFPLLKSTPSNKSDNNEIEPGYLPEVEPLVQSSFSGEVEEQQNESKDNSENGLLLNDEKTNSSYSSVFEPEVEAKQNRAPEPDTRDSLCTMDPVIVTTKQRWNNQTRGSDSGVSVHSDALQGESFESNPVDNHASFEESKCETLENEMVPESLEQTRCCNDSVSSSDAKSTMSDLPRYAMNESCDAQESETSESGEGITNSLKENSVLISAVNEVEGESLEVEARNEAEEEVITVEIIQDEWEMPMDDLFGESEGTCIVDGKNSLIYSTKFEELPAMTDDEGECVFATGYKVIRISQSSTPVMIQTGQLEAEEHPENRSHQPLVSLGSTDRKERVETSLRIGGPRLISVSSIDSEPISPIIISIDPEHREFSMLEAEIEFSDDALSTCSEA